MLIFHEILYILIMNIQAEDLGSKSFHDLDLWRGVALKYGLYHSKETEF